MSPDPTLRDCALDEVASVVQAESGRILSVLDALHADPELSGREERAAARLKSELRAEGFEIESDSGGLPTAFVARKGPRGLPVPAVGDTGAGVKPKPDSRGVATGGGTARGGAAPVRIAFLAEYDALPEIGHGCGHNLIAASALGAAIAVGRVAGRLGAEIWLVGTPAEETIGGKVVLAARGVFDGLDAALMVHPGSEHRAWTDSLACRSLQVEFHGRAAHAVAHPDKGVNALDAMIQLFVAVDHIRRASRRDVRIPGVILEGGVRPNVVPARAVAQFSVRAGDGAEREEVVRRLRRAVEGISLATGCTCVIRFTDNPYDEMASNRALAAVYKAHLAAEGIATHDEPREHKGSLDMGNVSWRVPSIHPYVAIVPPEVASHTEAFAAASVSPAGREGTLLSARTMARTAVDLMCDPDLRETVRTEFAAMRQAALVSRGPGFDTPGELILERP